PPLNQTELTFSSTKDAVEFLVNELKGRSKPIQVKDDGYSISMTDIKSLTSHNKEKGVIPMSETPKDNASRPWSDELEAHKEMTNQRFDHLEKINTMQYESNQKDVLHGFELIASRIGSLEDKILSSEKDVTTKFDSLQGQIVSFQRETESRFASALENSNTKFDSFENKITLKMNEQKTEILNAVRTERKEDHKYIFSTLMTIMGVGFGALSILVAIALTVLTIVFT
ncbi:hypothetical protein ACW7EJ_16810, partial [Acinetobacter soli]